MKKTFIILVGISLLLSCATHQGSFSPTSISKNVIFEDITFGVSQTEKYFGIGGLSQDALVFEAKRELFKNRPLKPNEEYANFTLDFKNTYLLFYSQTKVTMSADVVRFMSDSINDPYSVQYKNKLISKKFMDNLFSPGDSVMDINNNKATIVSRNGNQIRILYKTKNDKIRTKNVELIDTYVMNKTYKGYKTGDSYSSTRIYSSNINEKINGKIMALGANSLIVLDDSTNNLRRVVYN